MKRLFLIPLIAIIACGLVFSGCAQTPAPATKPATAPAAKPTTPAEKVTLKCITFQPANSNTTTHFKEYFNEVNKRGKGNLVLELLGGPEVIARDNQPTAAKKGVVDMVNIAFTFYGGMVPIGHAMQVTEIPYQEEIKRGAWDYVRSLHAQAGLYWLGRTHSSMNEDFYWNTTKKITSLKDLAGQRAGAGSVSSKPIIEAVGGTYVQVQIGDVFTALERGVLDAYVVPTNAQLSAGTQKICKYFPEVHFFRGNISLFMGMDRWNQLPKEYQDLLQNTLYEMQDHMSKKWDEFHQSDRAKLLEAGEVPVIFTPEETEKFKNLAYTASAADVIKEYPETGPKLLGMIAPKTMELMKK
jgi:TRAP-type C4-dicarboxylate transport system substrate-binding protein